MSEELRTLFLYFSAYKDKTLYSLPEGNHSTIDTALLQAIQLVVPEVDYAEWPVCFIMPSPTADNTTTKPWEKQEGQEDWEIVTSSAQGGLQLHLSVLLPASWIRKLTPTQCSELKMYLHGCLQYISTWNSIYQLPTE